MSSLLKPPFSELFHISGYNTKLQSDAGERKLSVALRYTLRHLVEFKRTLAQARPDAIVFITGPGFAFWHDMLLLRHCHRLKVPIIVRFCGGRIAGEISQYPAPMKRMAVRQLSRTRALLAETGEMVNHLRNLFPTIPAYRVANFIYREDLPVPNRDISEEVETKIVYFGNMTPTKGVETILASVDPICDRHPAAFHFIGGELESGYLEGFRARAQQLKHASSVHVHGRLPRDKAHALAAACHIFAFPTQWPGEGQPAALVEAMGMGLVPVATPWRGVAEIVRDGVNGLSIAQPDPNALADAILRLIEDRSLLHTLSCNARETVLTEYEAMAAVQQYRQIVAQVLQTT